MLAGELLSLRKKGVVIGKVVAISAFDCQHDADVSANNITHVLGIAAPSELRPQSRPRSAQCGLRLPGVGNVPVGSFPTEADLVAAIRETFSAGGSNRWQWIAEFASTNGIADLAAFRLAKNWDATLSLGRVSARWAYALKWLPFREQFELAWFAKALNVPSDRARVVLNSYQQAGFCQLDTQSKTWCKVSQPTSPIDRMIAIEAKLRDWRRALYQASRYMDYAHQSWVVLDGSALRNALLHVDEFARRGVGLLALCRSGEIEIASRAAHRAPRSPHRFWQMSAEMARRLSTEALVPQHLPIEAV